MLNSVVIIGAGNVGHHLGLHLVKAGVHVLQVYSRRLDHAQSLAQELDTSFTTQLADLNTQADLYLLTVSDSAIGEVAAALPFSSKAAPLVVHCSGATPKEVLAPSLERYGVFYPLQTFTKGKNVDFSTIPICVDAQLEKDQQLLADLGQRIGCPVYTINDEQRATLHLAAVFVNNFTNHLYQIGEDLLKTHDLPFDLVRPLILETAQKVMEVPPKQSQTGPAIRGDQTTIERHLKALEAHPQYAKLYTLLTKSIQNI